jgi:hypothetical protein
MMDKILMLIIAAAIFAFLALVIITITSGSIMDVNNDTQSTQNTVICNQQTEDWEEGDIISPECVDRLPSSQQDTAEHQIMEQEYEEEITPTGE